MKVEDAPLAMAGVGVNDWVKKTTSPVGFRIETSYAVTFAPPVKVGAVKVKPTELSLKVDAAVKSGAAGSIQLG